MACTSRGQDRARGLHWQSNAWQHAERRQAQACLVHQVADCLLGRHTGQEEYHLQSIEQQHRLHSSGMPPISVRCTKM